MNLLKSNRGIKNLMPHLHEEKIKFLEKKANDIRESII